MLHTVNKTRILPLILSFIVFSFTPGQTMEVSDVDKATFSYQASLPSITPTGDIAKDICGFLLEFNTLKGQEVNGQQLLIEKINQQIETLGPIKMLLLGFPFKSTNHDYKCISHHADMAEYLGLITLQYIADQIKTIYEPSIQITIISDGLAYHTDIDESFENILQYHQDLMTLIKEFPSINFIGWKINEGIKNPMDLVHKVALIQTPITQESMETKSDLQKFVQKEFQSTTWDNFFLNQATQECGHLTGKPKQIQQAILTKKNSLKKEKVHKSVEDLSTGSMKFGTFVTQEFPNYNHYIRLSVHPHKDVHKKLGISLIHGDKGTPWHNAMVLKNGRWEFLDKKLKTSPQIEASKIQKHDLKGISLFYINA